MPSNYGRSEMFTPKEIRDLAAKHGMTMLPEDSPEYTNGPQTQFLVRKRSAPVVAPSPMKVPEAKASTKLATQRKPKKK